MDLWLDLASAWRHLKARPGFCLAIVSVLAIGIGANTAMFSAFEAWVLRPMDFPEPGRLVALFEARPHLGRDRISVSAQNYGDWVEQQSSFEALGAFHRHRFNVAEAGEPIRLDGARISAGLFPLLGKSPVKGRGFTEAEDQPGRPAAVALISGRLWRERFESDPNVVGRTLRLDGRLHEIVGVMEEGFRFPEWAEVWTPLGVDVDGGGRDNRWLSVVGRLAPGASLDAARAEMAAIAERLERLYPRANRGYAPQVLTLREAFVPPVIEVALTASLASGIFVLLVICANVASLLLAKASSRARETAVRAALGASRWRLVRHELVESALLALPAGLLGVGLGMWGVRSMLAYVPVEPPYLFQMGFSFEAGAYTLLISLLGGALVALAPVVRNSGLAVAEALGSGGRFTGGGVAGRRARGALVIGEMALSTALVTLAFLMVRSFLALQAADPGFEARNLLVAELSAEGAGLEDDGARVALAERLVSSVTEIPGVERASAVSYLPASPSNQMWELMAEGSDPETGETVVATVHSVAGRYFDTLGIELVRGRDFTVSEMREGGDVVIVSSGLAERLFGESDALGRRLRGVGSTEGQWYRVVGVVRDVDIGRDMVANDLPAVQLYQPYASNPTAALAVAARVRAGRDPEILSSTLRQTLQSAAPGIPVSDVLTMDDAVFRVRWVSRFFSRQLVLYALAATLVAAVGLYGLTVDSVVTRTRELAVRLALGAERRALVRMVMRESVLLSAAGVALGLVGVLLVSRLASSMLVSVSSRDPLALGLGAVALLLVAATAAFLPARRASTIDPMRALRAE